MVYVNDKKFACESCIKGHRSSNCQHTDRPLFEIKKKGRPVSQCERCRELRKTKRMHSKCTCTSPSTAEAGPSSQALASKAESATDPSVLKPKTRRFKPIAPALPNGIKDILPPTAGPSGTAAINLCRCGGKEPSICTCGHDRAPPVAASGNGGLAALAQAAMFCCLNDAPSITPTPAASASIVMTAHTQSSPPVAEEDNSRKHPRGCCSSEPSSRPPSPKPKRSKHASHALASSSSTDPGLPPLSVPPLLAPHEQLLPSSSIGPPVFPPIPPMSTISALTSFAPPECCCGTACACPGCLKHRGQAHASKDFEDCAEGTCGICVDHEGGVELPEAAFAASHGGIASFSSSCHHGHAAGLSTQASAPPAAQSSSGAPAAATSTSFIDAFFARAAALPPPPPKRTRPGVLDPTDVLVYPPDLFAGDAQRRKAFGLIEVPKLECNCPGGCGCPEGRCACGDTCGGCAPGHGEEEGREAADREAGSANEVASANANANIPGTSCCA
ncbi:hypothetical protein BV20DRAFT_967322 [Pilatotrama ljubarskyi]|nr:hypothetical protein BV20DRAFT_967322 [Pilatotrama ljubarskyi]